MSSAHAPLATSCKLCGCAFCSRWVKLRVVGSVLEAVPWRCRCPHADSICPDLPPAVPGTDGCQQCLRPTASNADGDLVCSKSSEGMAGGICFSPFWYLEIFAVYPPEDQELLKLGCWSAYYSILLYRQFGGSYMIPFSSLHTDLSSLMMQNYTKLLTFLRPGNANHNRTQQLKSNRS